MNNFYVPGQPITSEHGYLRGHGSYTAEIYQNNDSDKSLSSHSNASNSVTIVSCVAGQSERVNKLISVKPMNIRYGGEVGDLVVGRICAVDSKRWRVDINGRKEAHLQLSSINLPGGVQRMKTYEDQLQMRTLFVGNDLISAEIQTVHADGVVSLHARSLKYGKLENGQLIIVSSSLIKRLPQHYVTLPIGIDVILGRNGFIWITRSIPEQWKLQAGGGLDDATPQVETLQHLKTRHQETPLSKSDRLNVARIHNSISLLNLNARIISPESILTIYNRSVQMGIQHPKEFLQSNVSRMLLEDSNIL